MTFYTSKKIQECALKLSCARNPTEAVVAWATLNKQHPELQGIVSFDTYDKSAVPNVIKKYTKSPFNYLTPYYSSQNLYFLDDNSLHDTFSKGEAKFKVDYTLMFDTNIASYINKLIRQEPLKNMQREVVSLVDELLNDDINFDHLFYMIENSKNVDFASLKESKSKLSFWKSLDKDFKNNMVSLQLFSSIDCKKYKRTLNPEPTITYNQAVKKAANFSYSFYASEEGMEIIKHFRRMQRMMLLQLIGMVRTQVSSKKNAKNKLAQYFEYIHNVVGVYFDRESVLAYEYFKSRNNLPILNKVQKGCSKIRLLKRLDNIAWDMIVPRLMEYFISNGTSISEGNYFIPFFLSFDKNLRGMNKLFQVKATIMDSRSGDLIPIPSKNTFDYFSENGCSKEIDWLQSDSAKSERLAKVKPSLFEIHKLIKEQYSLLRKEL